MLVSAWGQCLDPVIVAPQAAVFDVGAGAILVCTVVLVLVAWAHTLALLLSSVVRPSCARLPISKQRSRCASLRLAALR